MRLILLLLFFISCSDTTGYDRRAEFPQEEVDNDSLFPFDSFDTRLSPNLRISGIVCEGGEIVDSGGRTFGCIEDQWLVTVDNINFCTPEGCTEVEVQPIIAVLQSLTGTGEVQFFEIAPAIPVSDRIEGSLDNVLVRLDQDADPIVVFE